MEKKMLSLAEFAALATELGMRASAKPFEEILLKTTELKPLLKNAVLQKTANGSEVRVFSIHGFTVKYERNLELAIIDSETVTVGFFKAEVDSKSNPGTKEPINWIRIIACA